MNEPLTVQEAPASYQVMLDTSRVRQGYKQTEVGVIPADWEVRPLGELTTAVASGRSKSNAIYGNYAVHGSTGVIGYSDTFEYKGDAILVARVGANAGKLNIVSGEYGVTDNTIIVRFGNGSYLPFFWRQMDSKNLNSLVFGSGQPLITGTQLKALAVCVPPLPEQRAIATTISDVDALLVAQDKLIAKKRDIKHAAMQQLLTGKQRLPGFTGEWEVKRLGDVVEIKKGQLITEQDAIAGSVPVIAGGKKPAYYHNKPNRTGKTITVSASGASAGYVAFFDTPIFASDCSTISESKTYSIEFIFFQLQLKQDVIYKAQTGGAQPHIHAVDLMPIEIGCPSLPEQNTIATILSDMDADLAALEQQRDKTRALKLGMMQELLTGRIRLV